MLPLVLIQRVCVYCRVRGQPEGRSACVFHHRPPPGIPGGEGQHGGGVSRVPAPHHAHLLQVRLQGPPPQPGPAGREQGNYLRPFTFGTQHSTFFETFTMNDNDEWIKSLACICNS